MANRLKESELISVRDNLDRLNKIQRRLWDHFYSGSDNIKPLNKSQIVPEDLVPFLRNIWMADITYEEDGEVTGLVMRLLGTALATHYGELTGERIIEGDKLTNFAEKSPDYHKRLKQVSTELVRKMEPLLGTATYRGDEGEQITNTTIIFPMRHKSDQIDMVFGFTESETTKAGVRIS